MYVAVDRVLSYPGLTDREIRLLLTIASLQDVRKVVRRELRELLSVSRSTLDRALRKLKAKGLLVMERVGSTRWAYKFSLDLMNSPLMTSQISGYAYAYLGMNSHRKENEHSFPREEVRVGFRQIPEGSLIFAIPEDPRFTKAPLLKSSAFFLSPHYGEHSHVLQRSYSSISLGSKKKDHCILRIHATPLSDDHSQNAPSVGESSEMATLKFRKRTPLVNALEDELKSSTGSQKSPKRRLIPFTKQSRMERLREKMRAKDVSEYNCTDMRFVFEDEWTKAGWKGYCPRWTGKDYGLMKMLIKEFGSSDTVDYVQFVCRNWENLCTRYRVNGYPSMGVIKAYSSSWYPEMKNGAKDIWGAECSGHREHRITEADIANGVTYQDKGYDEDVFRAMGRMRHLSGEALEQFVRRGMRSKVQ